MSMEEAQNDTSIDTGDVPQTPTESLPQTAENRKRPRLDLSSATGRERKRGKSMFGLLVGTLNKAKIEDKERNASEAAKKRQLIEQRLQAKLRKETDSVRRAEEAKKEKTSANRKEEDLQLKDSIYKLRRTRLPLLANFLLTSDLISTDDDSPPPPTDPLVPVPRSHPPPLYYLPVILTPAQQGFIEKRKADVTEAVEKEWQLFHDERTAGIEEINQLRQHVAEEEARQKTEKKSDKDEMDTEHPPATQNGTTANLKSPERKDVDMDVDDSAALAKDESKSSESEKKEEPATVQGDDDDAVEY